MSSESNYDQLLDSVRANYRAGALAHAFVIGGSPRGEGRQMALDLAAMVFCETGAGCGTCSGCRRVKEYNHPDVHWVEPQSKSRLIVKDDMLAVLSAVNQKSFEGGWKVVVLLAADRMNDAAANKFLKTLEEPPPKTLLLLVTESPSSLLATIRSRCQMLSLSGGEGDASEPWQAQVLDVLRHGRPEHVLKALLAASYMNAIMANPAEAEEEDVEEDNADKKTREAREGARQRELRARVLTYVTHWYRDLVLATLDLPSDHFHFQEEQEILYRQARELTYRQAYRRLQSLEVLVRRLEQNLPPVHVFEQFFVDFAK